MKVRETKDLDLVVAILLAPLQWRQPKHHKSLMYSLLWCEADGSVFIDFTLEIETKLPENLKLTIAIHDCRHTCMENDKTILLRQTISLHIFLKAVFHKFYLVHSLIPWPKWPIIWLMEKELWSVALFQFVLMNKFFIQVGNCGT